jgi:hypothetical protein
MVAAIRRAGLNRRAIRNAVEELSRWQGTAVESGGRKLAGTGGRSG